MKWQRGFTLIEVLVAAAVLSIAATALFSLFSQSLFNVRRIEDLHRYELAAQNVMNQVLLLSSLPVDAHAEGQLDSAGGVWKVDVMPWTPIDPKVKRTDAVFKVHVAVTFPTRSNQRTIEIETLKAATIADSNYDLGGAIAPDWR